MQYSQNIASILPHSGNMLFIDKIISMTENTIHTQTSIKPNNPFLEQNGFPTYKALEFLAQSLGILKDTHQNKQECSKLGFLLGVRNMEVYIPYLQVGELLNIHSQTSIQDAWGSGIYDCKMYLNDKLILKASLNVFNPKKDFIEELRK